MRQIAFALILNSNTFLFQLQKSSDTQIDLEDIDIYTIDVVWSEIQFAVSWGYFKYPL